MVAIDLLAQFIEIAHCTWPTKLKPPKTAKSGQAEVFSALGVAWTVLDRKGFNKVLTASPLPFLCPSSGLARGSVWRCSQCGRTGIQTGIHVDVARRAS